MLSLSFLWILFTLGLAWFWQTFKVYQVAKKSQQSFQYKTWILFGKKLKYDQLDEEYRQRLNAVNDWFSITTPTHLIIQGGISPGNVVSEACAGKMYLESKGMSQQRMELIKCQLLLEDTSKNTLENLRETRAFLNKLNLPLQVGIISNRYHLLRCSIMADNMGYKTVYMPAEKEFELTRHNLLKLFIEGVFLNWYLTGRFLSKLLRNQRLVERVS